jgi:hypothetical protein
MLFPDGSKSKTGDGTRIRDVRLGKLHDTLTSTIYSPLVLIQEYQTHPRHPRHFTHETERRRPHNRQRM